MAVNSSPLNPIPQDLMYEILVWLPVKSLLRFKCVCKDWYNLINSSPFIQDHLNKSSETNSNSNSYHHNRPFVFIHNNCLYVGDDIDSHSQLVKLNIFDDYMMEDPYIKLYEVGCCRGLFCVRIGPIKYNNYKACFVICNPSTRHTSKTIMYPRQEIGMSSNRGVKYGFGYDIQHDDYKIVVMMLGEKKDMLTYSFLIYSLKADSWKMSPSKHKQRIRKNIRHVRCQNNVVYGNGMLHCTLQWFNKKSGILFKIRRFNLSSEEWEDDLSFPKTNLPTYTVRSTFIDGHFCICHTIKDHYIEVWSMKEYGVKESWTKVLRVPNFYVSNDATTSFIYPIAYSRRSQGVIIFYNNKRRHSSLIWYDPKYEIVESSSNELAISSGCIDGVYLCVESLISIPWSSQSQR